MTAIATSIHHLNGDRRLPFGPVGKLAYFVLNSVNNALPDVRVDPRLAIRDFQCPDFQSRLGELPGSTSPSRTLSDLFWLTLPWERIQAELGGIRMLDVGCGRGEYAHRLMSWSRDRVERYVGIDVHAHDSWKQDGARVRFARVDASDLGGAILDDANFIMSQSVIEHMDDDLRFFHQIRHAVEQRDTPTLQVHLCPSAACLPLYLLHGIRQYTPRTLSHITQLFGDSSHVLFRLGGSACNRLHREFITWPVMIRGKGDYRVTRAAEYRDRLVAAIARDMSGPQRSPSFYALVIHSHPRVQLF